MGESCLHAPQHCRTSGHATLSAQGWADFSVTLFWTKYKMLWKLDLLVLDFLWQAPTKQCYQPYPLCFFKNHFIFFLNLIISVILKENNLVCWVSLSDISISMVLLSSFNIYVHCVVPENIQTPTTEGIGNSRGVGGSEAQEIPEGRGVGQ